jgi:hypothetical protein
MKIAFPLWILILWVGFGWIWAAVWAIATGCFCWAVKHWEETTGPPWWPEPRRLRLARNGALILLEPPNALARQFYHLSCIIADCRGK